MPLIGRVKRKFVSTNQKHYQDPGSDMSPVRIFASPPQTSFCVETSVGVTKCRLFSQATRVAVSV